MIASLQTYTQVLVAVSDDLPLILVLDALLVTQEALLLSGKCIPRIYSGLVMASCEVTTVVHVNQCLTRQTFCSSSTKLVLAQSMNIAKMGLLAIEVDFLVRSLEHLLHATATTQNLPHLRSATVHLSMCRRPAHLATLPKISTENSALGFCSVFTGILLFGVAIEMLNFYGTWHHTVTNGILNLHYLFIIEIIY